MSTTAWKSFKNSALMKRSWSFGHACWFRTVAFVSAAAPGLRSWSSSSPAWRRSSAGCWRSLVSFFSQAFLLNPPLLFSFNFALSGASDHLKSRVERRREETLMQRLVEIVDGRNAIVEGLDEDRRR